MTLRYRIFENKIVLDPKGQHLDDLEKDVIFNIPDIYDVDDKLELLAQIDDLRKEEQNAPEIDLEAFKDAFKK